MLAVFRLNDWLVKRFGSAQKEEALELFQGETRNNKKNKKTDSYYISWLILNAILSFVWCAFSTLITTSTSIPRTTTTKGILSCWQLLCLFSSACIKACMREKRRKKTTTQWVEISKRFESHHTIDYGIVISLQCVSSPAFVSPFVLHSSKPREMKCARFSYSQSNVARIEFTL